MRKSVLSRKADLCRLAFAIFAVSFLIAGCRRAGEQLKPTGESKITSTIGVCLAGVDTAWRQQLKADIESAAAQHPELQFVVREAQNDPAQQAAHFEEFRAGGAKAILVSPIDPHSLIEVAAKAFDAGVPVVVLERALIGSKYTCFVAADPRQIGAAAGKWLGEQLGGKGKIVELKGPVDSRFAKDLHEAFRAELRDPGYRFVFEGFVDPPKVDGAKLMGEALSRVQEMHAVFAYDDLTARAAFEATKAAGRQQGVRFIGVGGLPEQGQRLVKEGVLAASFLWPTGGREAVDSVAKVLRGEKVAKEIVPETRAFSEK